MVYRRVSYTGSLSWVLLVVFFQAEDGIRDLVRSRGLGDVYKRQVRGRERGQHSEAQQARKWPAIGNGLHDLLTVLLLSLIHI